MTKQSLFDHYSFRARLQPALITLLPLALGVFAWAEPGARWMTAIWTLLGTSGATYLLAILARDRGRRIESLMWKSWGGAPTTQLLRHAGPANPVLRMRWHESLSKQFKNPLPTASEEQADPRAADEVYAAVTRLLINARRDTKAFPLIYKENVSYGFCRNLIAQRAIGIAASLIGTTCAAVAGWHFMSSGKALVAPWACAGLGTLMLCMWLFMVTWDLARTPAFTYAERLLESSDAMSKTRKSRSPSEKV